MAAHRGYMVDRKASHFTGEERWPWGQGTQNPSTQQCHQEPWPPGRCGLPEAQPEAPC